MRHGDVIVKSSISQLFLHQQICLRQPSSVLTSLVRMSSDSPLFCSALLCSARRPEAFPSPFPILCRLLIVIACLYIAHPAHRFSTATDLFPLPVHFLFLLFPPWRRTVVLRSWKAGLASPCFRRPAWDT